MQKLLRLALHGVHQLSCKVLEASPVSAGLLLGILAKRLTKIDLEAVEELLIVGATFGKQLLGLGLCALLFEGVCNRAGLGKLVLDPGLLGLQPSPVLSVESRSASNQHRGKVVAACVLLGRRAGLRPAVGCGSPHSHLRASELGSSHLRTLSSN